TPQHASSCYFLLRCGAPRDLHSFPTRRSSDLYVVPRDNPSIGLFVGGAIQSRIDGEWLFPITRRLERSGGTFGGTISARGRVEYFRKFYQDVQLDPGTRVSLVHRNGTLLARNPQIEAGLGRRLPPVGGPLQTEFAPGDAGPPPRTRPPHAREPLAPLPACALHPRQAAL